MRQVALEPRVSVSQILSDNFELSGLRAESDAITRITAGLGWRGRTSALRGYLDYALTGVVYARHRDRSELQNALNANLTADLIDNRLQLVTSAAISRSAISAFGVQPGGAGDANSNVAETRTLQVSPTMRGPLGPALRYTAAFGQAITSTSNASVGDSTSSNLSLHLEPASRARLEWALDASHLNVDYRQGRSNRNDRLSGGLRLNLDDLDLQLSATGGIETTNIVSLDNKRYSTWGVGALWAPSPVTRVKADFDERFFGSSHALSIEHRTARTIFRLRSARTLSTSGNQVVGQRGEAFQVFDSLLSSAYPDRDVREAQVNKLLSDLNWDRARIIDTGFLRSAATLQDVLEFSAAWTGPRNSAVLLLSHAKNRRVDGLSNAVDDLSNVDEVRTRNLSLNLSQRITPLSSLSLLLSTQRNSSGPTSQFGRQTQAELQFTTRLSPDSTLGAGLRRAHFNNGAQSFDETALSATVGARF